MKRNIIMFVLALAASCGQRSVGHLSEGESSSTESPIANDQGVHPKELTFFDHVESLTLTNQKVFLDQGTDAQVFVDFFYLDSVIKIDATSKISRYIIPVNTKIKFASKKQYKDVSHGNTFLYLSYSGENESGQKCTVIFAYTPDNFITSIRLVTYAENGDPFSDITYGKYR